MRGRSQAAEREWLKFLRPNLSLIRAIDVLLPCLKEPINQKWVQAWATTEMINFVKQERRLAAILAADVVGYSRLMGADEVGTLNSLKAHRRELIDPAIATHAGRIVKTTG